MPMRLAPPLLGLVFLAAACSKDLPTPAQHCGSDPQCPAGSRCVAGVCSGDTRPTAAIADPGPVQEFALVTLDGSASADPDGDVSTHRWSIRSVDAPCAPPEVAGLARQALVRFACAGRYEVTLMVADALGLESDPARREVVVGPSSTPSIVSAGPDLRTDHRCEGSPLRCRPTSALQLTGAAPSGASIRWTVQPPPERPVDGSRRVTLSSDTDPQPTVEIVTDGTAISGDWVFRLEAFDAHGVIGADVARVVILNNPPVVTFTTPGPFEHAFDAVDAEFTSSGSVAFSVTDPDGDPISSITPTWRHLGDGLASVFDGERSGSTVSFRVIVPYTAPVDALNLRGGDGLVRQIEIAAVDVNQLTGVGVLPIEIGNRPPVLAGGKVDTSVPHRFDRKRSAYIATVQAGTFVDPDGDPIVDSSAPGICGTIHATGNDVTVECSVPFEGVPALDQLVGNRTFSVAARDPWDPALQQPVLTVEILNSPPALVAGAPSVPQVCTSSRFAGFHCGIDMHVESVAFSVSVGISDPDGDPVLVTGGIPAGGRVAPTGTLLKSGATVPFEFVQPPVDWRCLRVDIPGKISTVTASDGALPITIDVTPPLKSC